MICPKEMGARQTKALDLADALPLANPRQDRPPIAKPAFSIIEEQSAPNVHAKLLGAERKPISDLQRTALQGVALHTRGRPSQPRRQD
jgi:hypothetical protein